MNKKAYVTAIKIIGKLAVRAGLHRDPGYGGGWDESEKSLIAQALDEYKFYNLGSFEEPGRDTSAGSKRQSTRAA